MDEFLGDLFQIIDELGLRENTYIFFMSDNGWMLGEHGFTSKVLPYRQATHVPWFVLGPNVKRSVNDQLVLNSDMAPTILELAGIKIRDNIHGQSVVPLINGKKKSWRDAFVYEGLGTYGGAKPNLTAISKDYKLIVTYEDEKLNKVNFRELYYQKTDRDEMKNLSQNPKFKKVMEQLENKIEAHRRDVLKMDVN